MATYALTPASFSEASRIARLDSHTYEGHLVQSYCVGDVPNGGYVATVILKAANAHLAPRAQVDTICAHWQFINKTSIGPAIIVVEDTKFGRGVSVLHLSLYQEHLLPEAPWVSSRSTKAASAYITNGNISAESGVTLPTGWTEIPEPPPVVLTRLAAQEDAKWELWDHYLRPKVLSLQNVELYRPRAGHPLAATHDVWLRLANGERWHQPDLAFVLDVGPPLLVESFRPTSPDAVVPKGGFAMDKLMWYPTIVASLEMKKCMPAEGVDWLRYRCVCKRITNGRYDAEVQIFDAFGDLVALSHHVALAVGMERNRKSASKEESRL